jgi:hypothetical protein
MRQDVGIFSVVKQTVFGSEVTGVLWGLRVQGPDDLSSETRKLHGVPEGSRRSAATGATLLGALD